MHIKICAIIFLEIDTMENNGNANYPCISENTDEVLAMARVPMQKWCNVYDGTTALSRGTLFPSLDLPFIGRKATE